jgi:hypothetical protein
MKAPVKIIAITMLAAQLGFVTMVLDANGSSNAAEAVVASEIASNPDEISEKTYVLIEKKLEGPYKSKVKTKVKRGFFSRCPSGYNTYISQLASCNEEYSYGEFTLWEGCEKKEICSFRARLSDNTVDVLQSDSVNYLAANTWLNNTTSSLY